MKRRGTASRARTKTLRLKQIKDSGWYEFLKWAINEGYTPNDLADDIVLTDIRCHISVRKLLSNLMNDLYSNPRASQTAPMKGLLKILTEKN